MIRNDKCEVLDKQNFEPKYRRFTIFVGAKIYCLKDKIFEEGKSHRDILQDNKLTRNKFLSLKDKREIFRNKQNIET
jgi:hypothetical protein